MTGTGASGQRPGGPVPRRPAEQRLHLLMGGADLLRERGWRALLAELEQQAAGPTEVAVCDAAETSHDNLVNTITTVPLFAERQVVVIRRLEALTAKQQERLIPVLGAAPPPTTVILECGVPEGAVSGRAPVAAALLKFVRGAGVVRAFEQPRARDLPGFVQQELRALGKHMRPRVVTAFLGRAGQDPGCLRMELEKLALYVGEREEIGEEDVAAVTTAEPAHTIFELVDAIGERRADRALAVLPRLLPETDPRGASLAVLGMVSRQLRLIWQAREALDAQVSLSRLDAIPDEVQARFPREHNLVDTLKRRSFLTRRYADQAARFTPAELAAALRRVFAAEMTLKGQTETSGYDALLTLETMIADLCAVA